MRLAGNEVSIGGERFTGWPTSPASSSSESTCDVLMPAVARGGYDFEALRREVDGSSTVVVAAFGGVSAEDVAWAASYLAQSGERSVVVATALYDGGIVPVLGIPLAHRRNPTGRRGEIVLRLRAGGCGAELEVRGGTTTEFDWRGQVLVSELTAPLNRVVRRRRRPPVTVDVASGWAWSDVMSILELLRSLGIDDIALATHRALGSLSREVIRRVIQDHVGEVVRCYEPELRQNHALAGEVRVRFVIASSGEVSEAGISHSSLGEGGAVVERCIEAAVRTWRFPAPEGGGIVIVNYPFRLSGGD